MPWYNAWFANRKKKALAALDLTPVRRALRSLYDWTASDVRNAEFNYRKFLERLIENPKLPAVAPNDQIDLCWQAHILLEDGRYEQDCRKLFGGYLFRPPRNTPPPAPRNQTASLPIIPAPGRKVDAPPAVRTTPAIIPPAPIVRFATGSEHGVAKPAAPPKTAGDEPRIENRTD